MTIDPRIIAADIMCGNARSITAAEVWAHIGQAYDTTDIDAAIADEVADLIAKTGIDLTWPDGTKNTELDAVRADIERLTADRDDASRELTEAWAALAKAGFADPDPDVEVAEVINRLAATLAQSRQQAATYANEIGALKADLERMRGEWDRLVNERAALLGVVRAAKVWRDSDDLQTFGIDEAGEELVAAVDALPKAATV